MKTKKRLFILLLLPLLLLLHSSFFLLPHNPQAPSLPHHPWAVSKTPSISCILASHHLPYVHSPNPSPSPYHAPRERFYCRVYTFPPNMKPATKYGEGGKKNRSHPSRWCILMGGLVASASSMALFLFFFMIDRTGGATTVHTREVPYLCIYVPGRYGTLRSLCLGRYSIHGCCHTLIHYFFLESRKGIYSGRWKARRIYICACVCVRMRVLCTWLCVCPWIR